VKGQCEKCGELAELEVEVEAGRVRVRCPACAARYLLGEKPSPTPASPPAGEACPKCGAARSGEACPKCGLVYEKWDPENAGAHAGDAEASALWERCLEAWDDGPRHDSFIEHCRKSGVLAFAAARYRQKGDADRLKQIRTLAEQTLAVPPRVAPPPRRMNVAMGAALIVILMLAGYAALQILTP
jgi:hypothetical protein